MFYRTLDYLDGVSGLRLARACGLWLWTWLPGVSGLCVSGCWLGASGLCVLRVAGVWVRLLLALLQALFDPFPNDLGVVFG